MCVYVYERGRVSKYIHTYIPAMLLEATHTDFTYLVFFIHVGLKQDDRVYLRHSAPVDTDLVLWYWPS